MSGIISKHIQFHGRISLENKADTFFLAMHVVRCPVKSKKNDENLSFPAWYVSLEHLLTFQPLQTLASETRNTYRNLSYIDFMIGCCLAILER